MKTSKHNNFTTSLNYDPEIEDIINSFVTLTGVAYKEAARYIEIIKTNPILIQKINDLSKNSSRRKRVFSRAIRTSRLKHGDQLIGFKTDYIVVGTSQVIGEKKLSVQVIVFEKPIEIVTLCFPINSQGQVELVGIKRYIPRSFEEY